MDHEYTTEFSFFFLFLTFPQIYFKSLYPQVLDTFLQHPSLCHIKQRLLVGGDSVDEDVRVLREGGGHVLICTPGRLEDLLTRRPDFNLSVHMKSLVIFCDMIIG